MLILDENFIMILDENFMMRNLKKIFFFFFCLAVTVLAKDLRHAGGVFGVKNWPFGLPRNCQSEF